MLQRGPETEDQQDAIQWLSQRIDEALQVRKKETKKARDKERKKEGRKKGKKEGKGEKGGWGSN